MTVNSALKTVRSYYNIGMPDDEQDFDFVEALTFLIAETGDSHFMMELGGWFYERRSFDLALKYYDMAADCGNPDAYACLGYVWYYGRTGKKDYEKAYRYYSLSAYNGNLESAYKVADMYKNGFFVEKNYEKYKEIIEELYGKIKDDKNAFSPLPQIFMRLARIRSEEGKTEEAIHLYLYAKHFLAQRLRINSFFGDLNNMKWLTEELYGLIAFDEIDFDLYDLYYLLQQPVRISFCYNKKKYYVESMIEEGECVICFDNQWYRTVDDFFGKASVNNHRLTELYNELYLFEVT